MSLKPKPKATPQPGKVLSLKDADDLNKQIASVKQALGKLVNIASKQKQVIHYGPRCPHR